MHVVRLVRIVRHDVEQRLIAAVARIGARAARRLGEIVRRDEPKELADLLQARDLGIAREVRDAGHRGVRVGAAERLHRDIFVRHRLHDVGPGDEHVRRAAHHVDEVGDRGRVHRAAGARPEDGGDLRHDAGGQRVAQEDVGVAAERDDALLDARAAGVVEADHRRAVPHGEIHHLADLLRVRLGQRAAEHGEVLREDVDEPAVDAPVAGDDAVAEDARVAIARSGGPRGDEPIELHEAAVVEQEVEPLARGELPFLVLRGEPRRSAAELGRCPAALEQLEFLTHRHGGGK